MPTPSREQLVHMLYEAAELEHDLMCTYLYAAFSLKSDGEGLRPDEAEAVARWRRAIIKVSTEEMAHLVAVWNLTSALGGTPRFGRENFPLGVGNLPASVVVRLAPFNEAAIQHFVHLERPATSQESEGAGFEPQRTFRRGDARVRVTPMAIDYETVGAFYQRLADDLRSFADYHGDAGAFFGDPALQLSGAETELIGIKPVICVKTALAALSAIVAQGEGAPGDSVGSHYQQFVAIRDELATLRAANPDFAPAYPAAHNPVLRPPPKPEGRVWIEDEEAAHTVDIANSVYGLMLRLIGYSYMVPRPSRHKQTAIDLALSLMRAMTLLAERAARLPAGPSNPGCHAGMSFTTLREAAPLVPGPQTSRFFAERIEQLLEHASSLDQTDARVAGAIRILRELHGRVHGLDGPPVVVAPPAPAPTAPTAAKPTTAVVRLPIAPPTPTTRDGVDYIDGTKLTLIYEGRRCIHSRFCVTGAPQVFLANVKGPWIHPDAIPAETLIEIAHACPSGAIRYQRKDGGPDETAPPVNLIGIRENGPYAVHADMKLDGDTGPRFRATLCRCGASKSKPFCDSSHHEIGFTATGEPATTPNTDMLAERGGELEISPQLDGPLRVRGNLEIISGTGRVVARVEQAKLCRCGGSSTKPFCDGTHQRIGFRST